MRSPHASAAGTGLALLHALLASASMLLAPAAAATHGTGPAEPIGVGSVAFVEDLEELVELVKSERDRVDAKVFRRITRHRNEAALDALEKAIGYLRNEGLLGQAYGAAADFADVPGLREDVVDFLYDDARKHKRDENQRAATRALGAFGPAAHAALRRVAEDHREEDVRAIAVDALLDVLGAEGTVDAAELIVDNSGVRFPGQRERVEAALRRMHGEDVVAFFVHHVEDTDLGLELRLLLLEVLAERESEQVDALVLDLMNANETQLLLRAVEMAGQRRLEGAGAYLLALADGREANVARAAIVALGRIRGQDPAWQADVFEYADSRRTELRMGAAAALGLLRNDEALARLHGLLADGERTVRIEALQAVGNLRQRASIPFLIGRLDHEKGRIAENLATTLRLFTGLDLGTLTTTWQRWWEAEGKDQPLPAYEEALAAEEERRERRAENLTQSSFYGLQVVSDRVVFVMDVSGSMSQRARGRGERTSSDRRGGSTRMAVAQEELRRVLTTLPDGDWFNLIFFEGSVRSWLDELEEMDDDAREDALEFVERQRANGGTAVYDALERAFEDEQIDTIYLLSDGEPSAGKVIDPGRIRLEVQRWNAIRKVQINTVSVGQASQLLRWLAEDSGGRYVEVL